MIFKYCNNMNFFAGFGKELSDLRSECRGKNFAMKMGTMAHELTWACDFHENLSV